MRNLPENCLRIESAATRLAPSKSPLDVAEKVKELVRLAQEQGYLTYNDINDALPDGVVSPDELGRSLQQAAQPGSRDR